MKFPGAVMKIAIGVITLKLRVKETVAEIWRHPVTKIAISLMAGDYFVQNNVRICNSQLHLHCCITRLDYSNQRS
jgi:hypothetical protein